MTERSSAVTHRLCRQRSGQTFTVKTNESSTPDLPPISPNLAAPIDAAVAFNEESHKSTAGARAEQEVDGDQKPEADT